MPRFTLKAGGDSKELHSRCREAFRKLLEKCGFVGRMPRLVACGGRDAAYKDFVTAYSNAAKGSYVALLDPEELRKYLPSFARFERVLNENL